jgi:hypothetical protein
MAGEGAMMQAIQSLAYNKSLRNKHNRSSWKDIKIQEQTPGNDSIKSSPELLEAIKNRLQAENKKRKKQQILLAFFSLFVAIFLIYLITISII